MSTRGRKPKPTAIRIAEGNRGKGALPQNEAKPARALPACPRALGKEARREWRRIAGELYKVGLLTNLDRGALTAYCFAYGEMLRAIEKAKGVPQIYSQVGSKCIVIHPYLQVGFKSLEAFLKVLTEFGLSPASRARVIAAPPKEEESVQDFIKRRNELKLLQFQAKQKEEDANSEAASAAQQGESAGVEPVDKVVG